MSVFKKMVLGLGFLVTMALAPSAFADYQLNMTQGVTPVSRAIYDLHMTVFWICVAIGIIVFGIMLFALIRHRKSKGAKAATFHEHTTVEVVWAIIPFLILIAMAIPATKVLILMDDDSDAEINIKVTGYQWKWRYDYVDEGFGFMSTLSTPQSEINNEEPKNPHYLLQVDNPLVLPIKKKIRFLVTSNDVIHSWWVPPFGVKRDAVPGFVHESWAYIDEPGTYRGQCAELCGVYHGFMPIVVEAKTQEDYDAWLASQRAEQEQAASAQAREWSKDELMEQGEQSYLTYCAACHQASGQGMPPTFPALKNSPIATGPVAKHIEVVVHGVSGTAMQAFGDQLSDTDLAAIITYERNAWGNNAGDLVQPSDIIAAKGGAPADAKGESQAQEPVDTSPTAPVAQTKVAQPQATDSETASAEPAAAPAASAPAESAAPTAAAPAEEVDKEYSKDELMKTGEEVYLKVCAVCHKPDGSGMPPVFPALSTSAIIDGPVAEHINRVLNGVPGTAMQAFGAQLNDTELAAVITYERNAWNDGKGGVVQPKEIQQARK